MRDLSIDRASRRHGYRDSIGGASHARRPLERAAAHARQAGCEAAFVDTFDLAALALYRCCGHQTVAALADFPPGQRPDRPDREPDDTGG